VSLVLRWIASAAAVWAAVRLVPGISLQEGLIPLFAVSLILGGVNAVVRPVLRSLACGLIFLTLGLFLLVINAGMLLLAAWIARTLGLAFYVDGFWPAFWGSLVISLVSYAASLLLGPNSRARRH
jgi:putative membrane protein